MNELYTMVENIAHELNETTDLYKYFDDVLDFEYTVDSRKNYRSVKIWVTLGGPNIWIDTANTAVCGAWGTSRESFPLSASLCAEIDSIFEEYYNC